MKLCDSSAYVDRESTRIQEIFYDNLFDISSKTYSFKIITTQRHFITWADASTILRTNVHWLEPTWDTWPDSQEEAKGLPPSEREAVGLMKNRRPNQTHLTNSLTFLWPCIVNYLYINYQLDALIIIYS
jgi:hypothetical protein